MWRRRWPDPAAGAACSVGAVAVLTAGTGDAAVAEECRRTAELMGCYVFRLQVQTLRIY